MSEQSGAVIRAARIEKGWSGRQLARLAGLTPNLLIRLERGQPPRADELSRLARALGWGQEEVASLVMVA